MKNKLTALVALLIFSIAVQGQSLKESAATEIQQKASRVMSMLYDDNGGVIIVRCNKSDISIEKYNTETLKLDYIKIYSGIGSSAFKWGKTPLSLYLLNNKPYLLMYELGDDGKNYVYALYSISNIGELTLKIKLADIKIDPNTLRDVLYRQDIIAPTAYALYTTGDEDAPFVFFYPYSTEDDKNINEEFVYLDNDLKIIERKKYSIAVKNNYYNQFSYAYSAKGEQYALTKLGASRMSVESYENGSKTEKNKSHYYLHRITKSGTFEEIKIDLGPDKYLSNAKLYTSKNGSPILIGVCAPEKYDEKIQFAGFFVVELDDIKGNTINNITIRDFDPEFSDNPVDFPTKDYIIVKDVFDTGNKDYTIIFQHYYTGDGNGWTSLTSLTNNSFTNMIPCSGVFIVSVDDQGIVWSKTFNNKKDSEGYYCAYEKPHLFKKEVGFTIVFDADWLVGTHGKIEDREGVFLFNFDEKGNYTKSVIKTSRDMLNNLYAQYNYPVFDSHGNLFKPWYERGGKEVKLIKIEVKQ